MNAVIPYLHDFEGASLATYLWNGRPCWVARHLGVRLGYAQAGRRLPSQVLGDWADEFIPGRDYALLQGSDLVAFQDAAAALSGEPRRVGQGTLLVLFESGLHLVLAKTEQPVGRRLRRFLVDEVLPQLARTGRYLPDDPDEDDEAGDEDDAGLRDADDGVPGAGAQLLLFLLSPLGERPVAPLAWLREARMGRQVDVRGRWVDLCDRRLKVRTLHRAIDGLRADGLLPSADLAALELEAVRIATGLDLGVLLAPPPPAAVAQAA